MGVAELGDKSMFAVIALAARYSRRSVFLGAVSALILVTVIGALIGGLVAELVDEEAIAPFAALVFLAFGAYILLRKHDEDDEELPSTRNGFVAAFSLIALMEMGDKTQIAVFTLAASSGEVLAVILGASLVFIVLVAIEVYLGDKLKDRLAPERMRLVAGTVFLLFGVFYLLQWLL